MGKLEFELLTGKTILGRAEIAEPFSASVAEKNTENGVCPAGPPAAPSVGREGGDVAVCVVFGDAASDAVGTGVAYMMGTALRAVGVLAGAPPFGTAVFRNPAAVIVAAVKVAACGFAFPAASIFVVPTGILGPLAIADRMAAACAGEVEATEVAGAGARGGADAGLLGLAGVPVPGLPPLGICRGSSCASVATDWVGPATVASAATDSGESDARLDGREGLRGAAGAAGSFPADICGGADADAGFTDSGYTEATIAGAREGTGNRMSP